MLLLFLLHQTQREAVSEVFPFNHYSGILQRKSWYIPELFFFFFLPTLRVIWETWKAWAFLLLKERTSVSNEKTRTRDSTHYRGEKNERTEVLFRGKRGGGTKRINKMILGPTPLKECAASTEIIKQNTNILIRQSFLILLHHLVVPWYSRGPKQWVIVHSICSELCSTYGIYIAETQDKSSPAVLWLS